MKSIEIRKRFIDYFKSAKHQFVPSSSMVLSDDPTLFFVNAGMNQFKDIFLGNTKPANLRVMNSQKCLRVSGKHNDLEEVGHDTYHHTMFEMLGNWSFGDYFKEKAIFLAWNFLTKELQISEERLYVTFFQGDVDDGLASDNETESIWTQIVPKEKIIKGSKKDNFWEMGKTGPCGPCTEIHIDLRSDVERKKKHAKHLINADHPEVIEIWNIVFIEFNRKKDNSLETLPKKHVDTGMGFERLCMILQNKKSTYDTDIFLDLIKCVSSIAKVNYGDVEQTDIAIRVIVDHIRAISFSIADGQLPSNNGAGYVIRRILRRAIRYGYTYLNLTSPFLYKLVDPLSNYFQTVFLEIEQQKKNIERIIKEEEKIFLKTLGKGLKLINNSIDLLENKSTIMDGAHVFELYDTYGFPPDLTDLILKEKGLSYNQEQFNKSMQEQKNRSRLDSEFILGDWITIHEVPNKGFVGYDVELVNDARLIKYRIIEAKGVERIHAVFDRTPFYPQGGGQIGDIGHIKASQEGPSSIFIVEDTKQENNLIIHTLSVQESQEKYLCKDMTYGLFINQDKRRLTTRNHSSTHLLHHALRTILGMHVEQKGSYVGPNYLRFDFSHFKKVEKEDLIKIEHFVNQVISKRLVLEDFRNVPMEEAKDMGAIALFGEKYGQNVRVVRFGDSIELCGGTHVQNTSEIGFFKITSEASVASGIRRIEAITSDMAGSFVNEKINILEQVHGLFKNTENILEAAQKTINENKVLLELSKKVQKERATSLIKDMNDKFSVINGVKFIVQEVDLDASVIKNICFSYINKDDYFFLALFHRSHDKIILSIALSKKLNQDKLLNASNIIKQVSVHINGKGGGQPFFAVASGDKLEGIDKMLNAIQIITDNF